MWECPSVLRKKAHDWLRRSWPAPNVSNQQLCTVWNLVFAFSILWHASECHFFNSLGIVSHILELSKGSTMFKKGSFLLKITLQVHLSKYSTPYQCIFKNNPFCPPPPSSFKLQLIAFTLTDMRIFCFRKISTLTNVFKIKLSYFCVKCAYLRSSYTV